MRSRLVEAMDGSDVRYSASFEEAVEQIVHIAKPGDLVLTMGAGNIHQAGPMVLAALASRDPRIVAPKKKPINSGKNRKKTEK